MLLVSYLFSFLLNVYVFSSFHFKGEMLYNKPCHKRKIVKCNDSYDVFI